MVRMIRSHDSAQLRFLFIAHILSTCLPIILLLASCGPKPKPTIANVPYEFEAEALDSGAILRWQINREGGLIGGYEIYLADSPEEAGAPYNNSSYPGDTDGNTSRESIELVGLENGKTYYAYVRTIQADGSLTAPSRKISFRPLEQGRITITSNYLIDKSGYSFAGHKYAVVRNSDNDFYIYSTGAKMGISSPSRMHSSLRQTRIKMAGKASSEYASTQSLSIGATYLLELANGGHAKMTAIDIHGASPEIVATFDYIYYPPGILP